MGLFDTVRNMVGGNQGPVPHSAGNVQQAPQPQQPNPQDRVPQNNPGADPNNLPPGGTSAPTKDPVISQLDTFSDLWQTPTPDPKLVDPLTQPLLSYDPAKFATEARKMNFTQGLDPALVAKALGGDADSFMQAINHAAQTAFISASQLSTNLVEGAAKTNNSRMTPMMESKFREFMLNQNQTSNDVMKHPSVAPVLELTKRQLLSKNPTMPAADIQTLAEQYVSEFASVFQQDKQRKTPSSSPNQNEPTDFSTWAN